MRTQNDSNRDCWYKVAHTLLPRACHTRTDSACVANVSRMFFEAAYLVHIRVNSTNHAMMSLLLVFLLLIVALLLPLPLPPSPPRLLLSRNALERRR